MSVSVWLARGQFEVVCYPVYCMDKYIVTDIRNAGEWDVGGSGFGSGRLIADRYLVQDIDSLKCLPCGTGGHGQGYPVWGGGL